jgi:hypothetical protein
MIPLIMPEEVSFNNRMTDFEGFESESAGSIGDKKTRQKTLGTVCKPLLENLSGRRY